MKKAKVNSYFSHPKSESQAKSMAAEIKVLGQGELDGALDTAVRFRDVLLTNALLDAGANPDTKDALGISALGQAIQSDLPELVELLLSRGADPNLPTGLSIPLAEALYHENPKMFELLLKAGADVNKTGYLPGTALYVATRFCRDPKLVATLLERGADPWIPDREGLTPLDWALMNRDKKIEAILRRAVKRVGRSTSANADRKRIRLKPKRK